MSFSGMVKEELSRQVGTARHCRIAETAALLSACGKMSAEGHLKFQTENEAVVRKYFTLLKKTFNIDTAVCIHESRRLKKGTVYYVGITDPVQVKNVLQGMKLSVDNTDGETLYAGNSLIIQQSCCKRAFIRGAFLASGSISDPEKGYHFEIVSPDERKAKQLQELIRSFQIDAKIVLRKKVHVVYVKEGAQIVDMLAVMEANVALMNLENIRILKEMRNSVNRKVNCETANINKTVNAAVKQIEDIRLIESSRAPESQRRSGRNRRTEIAVSGGNTKRIRDDVKSAGRQVRGKSPLKKIKRDSRWAADEQGGFIMIKKPITIQLSTGLEARPVAQLVQVASQFNSEIYVEIGQKKVNAKSIMGMMTLGLDSGEQITLSANGEDEEAAMTSIEKYLSNNQ